VGATERASGRVQPLGDGVLAEVARTGRPIRSQEGVRRADVAAVEPWSPLAAVDVMGEVIEELGPPGSVVAVPIMLGIRLLGVLAVHATESGRFTAEDEEVLATMASQAATALANAQRYAESERERRQTEALADVARAVGESLRPGDVLHLILRHARALLSAQGACIALRQDNWLYIVAGNGVAELLSGVSVPLEGSLLGRVARDILHGIIGLIID
jgi:GAF domain-containing protein